MSASRVHHRAAGGPGRSRRPRRGFLGGVVLMAASFLVYPAYPVLVLWPATDRARLQVTVVAAALSWALFSVGLYLAGRRGWVWLRRRWKARGPHPPSPPPPADPVIDCRPDGPPCSTS